MEELVDKSSKDCRRLELQTNLAMNKTEKVREIRELSNAFSRNKEHEDGK